VNAMETIDSDQGTGQSASNKPALMFKIASKSKKIDAFILKGQTDSMGFTGCLQGTAPWTLCCSGCSRPTSTPKTSPRTTTPTGTSPTRRSAPCRRRCTNMCKGNQIIRFIYSFIRKILNLISIQCYIFIYLCCRSV